MTAFIERLPVGAVIAAPGRPRHAPANWAALVNTVRRYGVEHLITVVSRADFVQARPRYAAVIRKAVSYVAVADLHHLDAARTAGITHVPVLHRPMPPDLAAFLARKHFLGDHLGPIEEARLLDDVLEESDPRPGQNEVARDQALSKGMVTKRLTLLDLIPEHQAAVERGDLPLHKADGLLGPQRPASRPGRSRPRRHHGPSRPTHPLG
ncbi:ParB/RepB/Spo0J family partition protein, partial [Kitasatospora sp. NPDC059327]|uniref:ParB/RepB/Spo0J family partition protein n=1 Tax=Kitasatospora sp. NPDC059327 TaxID=3346803 RepID=UPI00368189FE